MDLSKHLSDSSNIPSYWRLYAFPNGRSASVILDPRPQHPFRFEIESTDPGDIGAGGITCNLTSEQVEAKLALLAGLDTYEDAA